jgi:glycosyltransferase involved in cell wall biosynthesis
MAGDHIAKGCWPMMLWIDGQCLQTQGDQQGIGHYVTGLIETLSEGGFGFEISISFNAAMLDETLWARDSVKQWIKPCNIHVWQGIAEGGEAVLGNTESRRLSEIAIRHHVACLQPDIALSANPFAGAEDVAVPLPPAAIGGVPVTSIFYRGMPPSVAQNDSSAPLFNSYYRRRLAFFNEFDLNLCISEFSRSEVSVVSEQARSIPVSFEAGSFGWNRSASFVADAMLQAIRDRPRPAAADRKYSRSKALAALSGITVPTDLIVNTLARAEPMPASPKRLLVDVTSTILIDHGTGIQRVTKEITRNLILQSSENECVVVYGDSEAGLHRVSVNAHDFSASRKTDEKVQLRGEDVVLMLDSSWPYHHYHLPELLAARLRGADVVSCLYDLVPLRLQAMCNPHVFPVFTAWMKSALTYSNGFICISRAVADEFIAMLEGIGFPRPLKIGFWRLGADFFVSAAPPAAMSDNRQSLSFLMVGTIEPRKGHSVVLDAFETLWKEGFDAELVLVGKPGWGSNHVIERFRDHSATGSRLHWHAKVSDEELRGHYAACDALIAASYTEGFGLPIVEARHFDKPVIASDIAVFREVADGSPFVSFFDAGSPSSLVTAIRGFLRSGPDERKGAAGASNWPNWSASAKELHEVVVNDNWYRLYEPPSLKSRVSIFDHGATVMKAALDVDGRRHRLELIEGSILSADGQHLEYIVRVTNLSNQVWSSFSSGGTFGIFLNSRVWTADARELPLQTPRIAIPFVMPPGDSHYMRTHVPVKVKELGGSVLAIEMFQEPAIWWGHPLQINL